MTREGQEPNPEETFAPPASTRWSDQDAVEDDGLVAPFIPGRTPRTPTQGVPESAAAPDDPTLAPATPGPVEPEPADAPDEPFPFDMPWADDPEPGADADTAGTPSWDEPGTEEPVGAEPVAAMEEDDFPVEAFEIGHDWDRGEETGSGSAREPTDVGGSADAPTGVTTGTAAVEMAERLEWLASRLREEGPDGVERELASSDRLTSLLAALLAGHLASR